ncbi:MAG: M1 family peptidase, partial [Flavobacteriaceae bacterium]|nr:M1 family peptidase [Flavobacteriaceae bacterium]
MKFIKFTSMIAIFLAAGATYAQDTDETEKRDPGHYNTNRFKQMYEEFSTPNTYRSASGAPGPDYYQQQADYVMNIELDDTNAKLYGNETITYT